MTEPGKSGERGRTRNPVRRAGEAVVAATLLLTGCEADRELETYGGAADREEATVVELPDGRRIAVGTPDGYRLTAQVESPDGEVGEPVTIYSSDAGRYEIVRPVVVAAGASVAVQAQLVPDDLPAGEDAEDLHVGLLAATDDVDDLDDWAVVDEADPFTELELSPDGSEASQRQDDGGRWVWRGERFVLERGDAQGHP